MSVGRNLAKASEGGGYDTRVKKPRADQRVSGVELDIDPGSLMELDPEKVKREIVRWAKAVVAFASQLSFHGRSPNDLEA